MSLRVLYSPGIAYYLENYATFTIEAVVQQASEALKNRPVEEMKDGHFTWKQSMASFPAKDGDKIVAFYEAGVLEDGSDLLTLVTADDSDRPSHQELKRDPRIRFVATTSGFERLVVDEA